MTDSVAHYAPIDLNLLEPFLLVCDTGSFAKAAQKLGVERSSVSRAVAALEAALGLQLFVRTTRRVTPTTAGAALQAKVGPQWRELQNALRRMPEREMEPSGLLRLTTTHDIGTELLAPALAGFAQRYPAVALDVVMGNRRVDLAGEGFDLALRIALRIPEDAGLVAKRMAYLELQIFASPQYLARRPVTHFETLHTHTLLAIHGLHLQAGEVGKQLKNARVLADDILFLRNAAREGLGVTVLPTFVAQADVEAGRLVRVLPKVAVDSGTLFFVHPYGPHPPRKVTALREYLTTYLAAHPLVPRHG